MFLTLLQSARDIVEQIKGLGNNGIRQRKEYIEKPKYEDFFDENINLLKRQKNNAAILMLSI